MKIASKYFIKLRRTGLYQFTSSKENASKVCYQVCYILIPLENIDFLIIIKIFYNINVKQIFCNNFIVLALDFVIPTDQHSCILDTNGSYQFLS